MSVQFEEKNTQKDVRFPPVYRFLKHSPLRETFAQILPLTIRELWGDMYRSLLVKEPKEKFDEWDKLPMMYHKIACQERNRLDKELSQTIPSSWPETSHIQEVD